MFRETKSFGDESSQDRFEAPTDDLLVPWDFEATSGHHQSAIPNDFPLFDTNAIFTKAEPNNDPPLQTPSFYDVAGNLSKAEPLDHGSAVTLFDDIINLTLPDHSSTKDDWMAIIMDEPTSSLDLGVSLKNDVFVVANQESSLTVFPSPQLSLSLTQFPEANEDTYRWRGDQGLLDRLSYRSPDRIPQSWAETNVEPHVIEQSRSLESSDSLPSSVVPVISQGDWGMDLTSAPSNDPNSRVSGETNLESHPPSKKRRTRTNKKPPKGNNSYGRNGVKRCYACRSWRQKCVYESEDQPCTRCRKSNFTNCIKIFNSELKLINSDCRQWKDNTINDSDRKTLPPILAAQDSVSKYHSYDGPAGRALKRAIRTLGLRGCIRPGEHPSGVDCHNLGELSGAINELRSSLAWSEGMRLSHGLWDQILAAHLIAWILYSTYIKETNTSVYFKMSFAGLSFLNNHGRYSYGPFRTADSQVYGPFILDCANAWIVRNGEIVPRWTTFAQRVQYFDQFRVAAASVWYSSDLEAANSTLGNLMELGLHWLHRFAKQEAEFNFSREKVDQVLHYMRSELGDIDLQQALSALYRSSQGPNTNHSTVQGQLITRLFHRVRCVLFIHEALSADSIYLGVRARDALTIAQKVTYHCLRQVIRRDGPIEDYFRLSWHNFSYLMLGGIGLTDDCPRRIRDWVIDELMFIGREDCATALRNYWANGTIQELVQILELAQFPREMEEDAPV